MENSNYNVLSKILKEASEVSLEQRKTLIPPHIELVKSCNDQEELCEIAQCRDLDFAVRKAAAEKINDEVYLNYLAISFTTFGIDDDNVELILYVVSRVKDEDIVESAMEDILLGYITNFREDLFDKVLAKVKNIETLEKFIEKEERRFKETNWSQKAYERAMQLLENE